MGSQAIAETLVGLNNPSGRLPVTFYTGIDQIPAFEDYAMANRTYRYFKGKPLYGFGYGLSYTTFSYSNVKPSTSALHAGDTLTVEADVKNTGSRPGEEVAELYLTPPHTDVSPNLALAGFYPRPSCPGRNQTHYPDAGSAHPLGRLTKKGCPRRHTWQLQTRTGWSSAERNE